MFPELYSVPRAGVVSHEMQLHGETACIVFEIRVGGEDAHAPLMRHSTNQHVDYRRRDALCPAGIAPSRSSFVILDSKRLIRKGSERLTQILELGAAVDSG